MTTNKSQGTPTFSIIYISNRRDSKFQWFLESLRLDAPMDDLAQTQLIYVDHYAEETGRSEWATGHKEIPLFHSMTHVPVKPNVWTGSHRLTSVDYFAASNFRNTGLIHSKADHVVFIDDLSVVCPGWWDHVKESKKLKEVYFGTYEKHSEMTVEDGLIVGSIRDLIGVDTDAPSYLQITRHRFTARVLGYMGAPWQHRYKRFWT